ncbi:MAG: DNA-binding protein WhiA, partial [Chloroflexi bacterium]|nr:DNA-binding protein WhiA [Chloroflexota bacterium]
RDLVTAIRAELAAVEPTRACCRVSEAAGLGVQATGRAATPAVARLAVRLSAPTSASFGWAVAAQHCRLAYLRGRFLARGSLSIAGGRIHLEFVLPSAEAPLLAGQLADLGLPAAWRERRRRGVVTWKSTETVVTFLRLAGATAAVLELESRLVTRTLHGQLNRAINAEAANLHRSVVSSVRQVAAIRDLAARGRLAAQPPATRAVAEARSAVPEATYTELAAMTGTTRGVVQRALARLESLASEAGEPAEQVGAALRVDDADRPTGALR